MIMITIPIIKRAVAVRTVLSVAQMASHPEVSVRVVFPLTVITVVV